MLDRKDGMTELDELQVLFNSERNQLTSTSKVAIWRLIIYIVAVAIWSIEKLFDIHQAEINTQIANQKKGTMNWYRDMALRFQYQFDLKEDSDEFINGAASTDEIANSKIIKYAAVNEADTVGTLVIKIAGETNDRLAPITNDEQNAVIAYFEEIKYAGTRIRVINYLPDLLFLTIKIYRDPLVLDANGISIDGGKPVEAAIQQFMKELPFNGELVLAHLIDKLQSVKGVKIPHLIVAESSWVNANGGYDNPQQIDVKTVSISGYFEIPNFDNITYVV
jgi:hypothetical protein